MKKTVTILAVLLIAQLLLAMGVSLSGRSITTVSEPVALMHFDADTVDHIILEGADNQQITLQRASDKWVLSNAANFPANKEKVDQLLKRIQSLRVDTPVATKDSAQARFKVSDQHYERRITLSYDDKKVARLYLGSSPGIRLSHARRDEDNAIYTVKMATYDVPLKTADWEDKSILTLSQDDIVAIDVKGLQLKRLASVKEGDDKEGAQPSSWHADSLEPDQQLQSNAVNKLVELLAHLHFSKVLGNEDKAEYGLTTPVLELTLTLSGGDKIHYRVGKQPDKDVYTLKSSTREEYFQLFNDSATSLIDAASLEQLTAMMIESE